MLSEATRVLSVSRTIDFDVLSQDNLKFQNGDSRK